MPGRVVLCLGLGVPRDLADAGLETPRPVRTLREACEIARALLAGERVPYRGEVFSLSGRPLATGTRRVPVFLAASGPQTLALAGAVADGVLLSAAASVEYVRWALAHVDEGARGRTLERAGLVYAAVDDPGAAARLRRTLAVILRSEHHRTNLELAGSKLDQPAVADAVAREDWAAAEALLSDDVLRRHTAIGSAAEVRTRIGEYRAAGLDEVVLAGLATADDTRRTLIPATEETR